MRSEKQAIEFLNGIVTYAIKINLLVYTNPKGPLRLSAYGRSPGSGTSRLTP